MWVKIVNNNVSITQSNLPQSERLLDGSWVTGFPGADLATINAAGWYSAVDPVAMPNDGFQYTLQWSWNGTIASSSWIQGAPIPTETVSLESKIASFKANTVAAATLTDVKEAAAQWL